MNPLQRNNTLFLDLDGVLADLIGETNRILSRPASTNDKISAEEWKHIGENYPRLFKDLKLLPDAGKLYDLLYFYNPVILTAIPWKVAMEESTTDKRNWVFKHFGYMEVRFGPYAIDKQHHCKRGDVLVDDSEMNIKQWKAAGGIGFLYKDYHSFAIDWDDWISRYE